MEMIYWCNDVMAGNDPQSDRWCQIRRVIVIDERGIATESFKWRITAELNGKTLASGVTGTLDYAMTQGKYWLESNPPAYAPGGGL